MQSVKSQIYIIEIKLKERKTNLAVIKGGLNYENEIW